MRCKRISTFSNSAVRFAFTSGRTLNPITIALDAEAKMISDSVIAPTPVWIILTLTPSTSILRSDAAIASTEPCTSAFTIKLISFTSPSWICWNKSSRLNLDFSPR